MVLRLQRIKVTEKQADGKAGRWMIPSVKGSKRAGRGEIQGGRTGENQDFFASEGGKCPFFAYVIVIIQEQKIIATFSLHSRAMICNICKNEVAAGACSKSRL
jgi:hypothetical protein